MLCWKTWSRFRFFFNVYIGACSIRVKADVQPSPWLRFYSLHTRWTEINVQLPVLWFLSEFVLPLFSTVCTFIWYGLFIIYVSHDHLGKLGYCFHSYHLYITKTLPWPRHKYFLSIWAFKWQVFIGSSIFRKPDFQLIFMEFCRPHIAVCIV